MRVITNEEYQKEISNEAFVEQEHPRDSDGKFVKKGTGSSSKSLHDKRIEKFVEKNDFFIKRILEKGGKPNAMDLEIAELLDKIEKESKIKTNRTFIDSDGDEITGTAKYENYGRNIMN